MENPQPKDECVVCFEETNLKTPCQHFLCHDCKIKLVKSECPCCRQKIKTWEYKDFKMPFYFFEKIFHDYYKKNVSFYHLKIGIENDEILSDEMYYYFHNEYANCTWTENYEKSITIRVYSIDKFEKYLRIGFRTLGLDSENSRMFYNCLFEHPIDGMDSFLWWIKQKILK